ncbi:YkgJ family cysteine cluster protein [Polymorphobacter sp. PAMC 29334]|uniref:YkgJ family cysteine cluster protein n=1 Tax=Polymorphobacter sp. PAMC 29334 TaxID=2862331 RepID=UPI001C6760CF|nr:YkgJ family cysteine cluster protein [Polymorphobacter sp. PAMC 29334]QYE33986.1 YkgJ family cysteine cluster protein [Polymorphobacter sp. PAMC 29334]
MATAPVPTITGEVVLRLEEETMTMTVTVPVGPTAMIDLLPLANAATGAIVERATARAVAAGRTISCRAGCGACCRQPVPLAPAEARSLAALVAAMPVPEQANVRNRFAAGQAAFAAANVPVRGDRIFGADLAEMRVRVAAYMAAYVACPFLVDESCSIHPDRPTACREYLVTSPAENCRLPTPETIARVELPGSISTAMANADRDLEGVRRVLLIDSLDWVATHPAPASVRTGPELIQHVFAQLSKT